MEPTPPQLPDDLAEVITVETYTDADEAPAGGPDDCTGEPDE